MKIGLYSGSIRPEEGGGYTIEKEIISSISLYKELTHHQFVLFSWYDLPQFRKQGFEIKSINTSISERAIFKSQKLFSSLISPKVVGTEAIKSPLQKIILQENIDVMFYLSPWENFFLDIPYFSMVWDLQHRLQPYFPEVSAGGEWEKREQFYKKNLPKASRIIIGNEAGRNEIHQLYNIPKERIGLIPHPTPSFALENAGRNFDLPKNFAPKNPYLFYPAQFWAHKNHINLLKALKILKEEQEIIYDLALVGSDKGNKSFVGKKAKELGVDSQVHFLGFVSTQELIALYQNAFALTYVTYFGPENLPPLEAFALGCPVIASRVHGAEEQIGEASILVNPQSPQEIVDSIIALRNNENLRNELIVNGQKVAQERSGEEFARKFFKILDDFEPYRSCWGI
ncbi:MAG: glycosyltransferase family 4 protein [Thermoflexibacter sp.]|jgi:glycosyltransferase involved in cell wall biosynthesis|nr:glycosyltransferase family 4 protein [Thermoflexibacter sp.]